MVAVGIQAKVTTWYNAPMPWAVRRRLLYLAGVFFFFGTLIGVPLTIILHKPPTCFDGIQNQGETDVDKGGPCVLLDERYLQPSATLWARSFNVRSGEYNAVAYIQNSNNSAGVEQVGYKFSLYDENNILVADDTGSTFIMPGAITPVFDGGIHTGNRVVTHSLFSFTGPLVWKHMANTVANVMVSNEVTSDLSTLPRVSATVKNTGIQDISDLTLVITVFDTAGNAFASSETLVPQLGAGESTNVVFTWPQPFTLAVGQVDILPVHAPVITQP